MGGGKQHQNAYAFHNQQQRHPNLQPVSILHSSIENSLISSITCSRCASCRCRSCIARNMILGCSIVWISRLSTTKGVPPKQSQQLLSWIVLVRGIQSRQGRGLQFFDHDPCTPLAHRRRLRDHAEVAKDSNHWDLWYRAQKTVASNSRVNVQRLGSDIHQLAVMIVDLDSLSSTSLPSLHLRGFPFQRCSYPVRCPTHRN